MQRSISVIVCLVDVRAPLQTILHFLGSDVCEERCRVPALAVLDAAQRERRDGVALHPHQARAVRVAIPANDDLVLAFGQTHVAPIRLADAGKRHLGVGRVELQRERPVGYGLKPVVEPPHAAHGHPRHDGLRRVLRRAQAQSHLARRQSVQRDRRALRHPLPVQFHPRGGRGRNHCQRTGSTHQGPFHAQHASVGERLAGEPQRLVVRKPRLDIPRAGRHVLPLQRCRPHGGAVHVHLRPRRRRLHHKHRRAAENGRRFARRPADRRRALLRHAGCHAGPRPEPGGARGHDRSHGRGAGQRGDEPPLRPPTGPRRARRGVGLPAVLSLGAIGRDSPRGPRPGAPRFRGPPARRGRRPKRRAQLVARPHATLRVQRQAPVDRFQQPMSETPGSQRRRRRHGVRHSAIHGVGPFFDFPRCGGPHECPGLRIRRCVGRMQSRIVRTPTRHHPPHQRAQRVYIRPRTDLAHRGDLFIRCIARRVRRPRTAVPRQIVLFRRTEVDQHRMGRPPRDVVLAAHENVSRLDVPVQHARAVHRGQPFQQRFHHRQQVLFCKRLPLRLAAPQKLRQRQAVVMVHDQVRGAVALEIVDAGHDGGLVPELSELTRLVPEAAQPVVELLLRLCVHRMHGGAVAGAHRQFPGQEFLDRVQPVGTKVVPRQVDDAEPAAAQLRLDHVVAQNRAWRQGVQRLGRAPRRHPALVPCGDDSRIILLTGIPAAHTA